MKSTGIWILVPPRSPSLQGRLAAVQLLEALNSELDVITLMFAS